MVEQQEMVTVGEKRRIPASCLYFHRCGVAAGCCDPVRRASRSRHEHNHVILVPGAAARTAGVGERANLAGTNDHGFQLALAEEPELSAVGLPEGHRGPVGIGQRRGARIRLERLDVEQPSAVDVVAHERQMFSIRRYDRSFLGCESGRERRRKRQNPCGHLRYWRTSERPQEGAGPEKHGGGGDEPRRANTLPRTRIRSGTARRFLLRRPPQLQQDVVDARPAFVAIFLEAGTYQPVKAWRAQRLRSGDWRRFGREDCRDQARLALPGKGRLPVTNSYSTAPESEDVGVVRRPTTPPAARAPCTAVCRR